MDRDRLRAHNAFRAIGDSGAPAADLLGLTRELPVMLQTNGLLATWAFLLARGKAHHQKAADHLLRHLREVGLVPASDHSLDRRELFERRWLSPPDGDPPGLTSRELRELTSEAIEYSVWLKRAAEALLTGKEEGA